MEKGYRSGSQLEVTLLLPREHGAMSGNIFGCHKYELSSPECQ